MPSILDGVHIRAPEYLARMARVRGFLAERGLDALCLFGSQWLFYFTGFAYQPTERPVCAVIPAQGEAGILAPSLERERLAGVTATLPRTAIYPEYPGLRPPMSYLVDMMADMELTRGRLACDSDGYGSMWGSRGPSLSAALPDASVVNVRRDLEAIRMIKSPAEIAAVRESARFGNLAHRLLQDYVRPGLTEIEIGQRASLDATLILLKAFGPGFAQHQWGVSPVLAGFKAGAGTAFPHPLPDAKPLAPGDLLVTWGEVWIDGYHAELERTLLLGQPTAEQRRYFDLMCEMQEVGFAALRPGRRCCDVDREVQGWAEAHGLSDLVRHHTGHAFGLDIHEPPYLDTGDETEILPGMLFSIEPGLYVPGLGGFRHSDTALVTETGCEILTYYPRDLESLTIPA